MAYKSSITWKKAGVSFLVGVVSVIYFGFALYYLSVPTSYNQAYDWVIKNLNQDNTVIINDVSLIEFPKNRDSYLLVTDYYCASKCQKVIEHDLNPDFKPLIIDKYTKEGVSFSAGADIYHLKLEKQNESDYQLISSFGNKVGPGFALDGRMSNYFDFDFFRIKNFGPDIYIYRQL